MNKKELIVPKGIKYLGNWKEFNFSLFPKKCILDKVIPGCGFTEYCINGPENVILCSPRKILLQNKYDQHIGEVFLVKNEFEAQLPIDKNLEKPDKSTIDSFIRIPTKEESKKVYNRIYAELEYFIRMNDIYSKPNKILVTYDSYHIVKDILTSMGVFDSYYTIVDEMQTILHDAKFKSDTELKFLNYLQDSPTSIFVSATPMMEEYLDLLDEFKDLPYYKLDWKSEEPDRVLNPDIIPLTMKSVGTKVSEIISKYKEGNFEKVNVINKKTGEIIEIESKEAVFYVNSVNHIINIIKTCDLKPEEVNILCSDTDYNQRRLKARLKDKYKIGKVPKKDEPNKMFTFCTRTVYLGADFYSKCARSFIFSDANIDTLAVDISEDLAQILGRQRDLDNPWAKSANFYYKVNRNFHKMSEEEFNRRIEEKSISTKNLLLAYEDVSEIAKPDIAKKYERVAQVDHYKDDYVAVDINGKPVLNRLVMIAERRSFNIQKFDYKDRVTLLNKISEKYEIDLENSKINLKITEYNEIKTQKDKLKYLCNLDPSVLNPILDKVTGETEKVRQYFTILGPERIKASGYNTTELNKEIEDLIKFQTINSRIYSEFSVGNCYLKSDIKDKLQEIYRELNIETKPKAVDLGKWFEISIQKIKGIDGKRINGLKLIKKL